MQSIVVADMKGLVLSTLVCVALLLSVGCGGGTTGTSGVDTFKLYGVTQTSNGASLPNTAMSVASVDDDQILLESQTDQNGQFAMDLPGDEEALVVNVSGAQPAYLERKLSGSGIVSTKLSLNSSGALSFNETLEAKIDESSLCSELRSDGKRIYQISKRVGDSCRVYILVRIAEMSPTKVQAGVRSSCSAEELSPSMSSDGRFSFDLAALLNSDCRDIELTVSAKDSSLQTIVFPVERIGVNY